VYAVIARGIADGERMAFHGWSHGGGYFGGEVTGPSLTGLGVTL